MKRDTFKRLLDIDRISGADLSAGAAALLALIQRLQRGEKWHLATGDALAAALKVSRRSICRYVAELEGVGLLAVWRRKAKRDGVAVNIANGYRVLGDAVKRAARDGLALRAARIAARAARIVGRLASRSCAKLAQHAPSKDIKGLWSALLICKEGDEGWKTVVTALIEAGEGSAEADFYGFCSS